MPACRIALLIVWLAVSMIFAGRSPAQEPAGAAADERAARLAERYKAMLAANPVEGIALDRLWKSYEDRGATASLIDEYSRASGTRRPPLRPRRSHAAPRPRRQPRSFTATSSKRPAARRGGGGLPQAATLDTASRCRPGIGGPRRQPGPASRCRRSLYEQALAKLPAADPRRADVLLKLGGAWLAAGQPRKAAEQWESMVALDPANISLRRELAADYEKSNLPERAIAHYEYIEEHGSPVERAQAVARPRTAAPGPREFDAARDAFERGLALTSRENWLHGEMEGNSSAFTNARAACPNWKRAGGGGR